MSLISTATYDQLEVMVKSAVSTGLHDHGTGRPHVPRTLLEKLQGLSQKYSLALKAYRDDKAMGKDLRKRRDEVSTRLARHVRNIHFMFHRLFAMGDVRRLDMTLFGIPETSMREAAHRIDIWRHQAGLIIRGFHERQAQGHDPLPPYLMSPAIIALIAEQKALADEVAEELRSLQANSQHRHQYLQALRAQVVHQMEWLHKHLEVSLFEHQRPIRIQIMKNYGIPVSLRRRSAQPQAASPKPATQAPTDQRSGQRVPKEFDPPTVAKREVGSTEFESATPPQAVIKGEPENLQPPTADGKPPTHAREPDSPAVNERVIREPETRRSKLPAKEELVEISDERWDWLMSDPDDADGPGDPGGSFDPRNPSGSVALEKQATSPKPNTPKKSDKKKGPVTTKGQRKPLTKKEKEKKKTNRKISRKSRRGK